MRKVFISYSSKDGDKAALVASAIEGMGCDCWMAPRDIAPGANYAEAIVDGLDGCMVFLLLLSSDSQASEHVVRELERSVSKGKKIMAVRLEKVSLSKSFEYFLQVTHWIDATDALDAASLAKVANAAVALTGGARAPEGSAPKPAQASPRKAGDAGPLPSRDRSRTFEGGQNFGDFEILGRLGQGGMGTVYKAQQISLERPVALKTLQGALASDPEYIARFRREAKAAAALNHPNLVQVYAAGENDGLHWFAMEYVEGESAQDRLKRKGRLDPAAAIAIGMNVATALDHGWRKAQLIHRDIKPDNIFLSTDGEVKLGDLGLAKSAGENQALTMTGSSMGTPHYVSPEQAEGKKDVDLRADIYSLGCTLFHLLSGKPPFEGGTALAVMMQHVSAPVPELRSVWPECPEELSRVVMKMMQKQPADRQQRHEEVIADLSGAYRALSGGTLPLAVTPNSGTRERPASGTEEAGSAGELAGEKRRSSRKPLAIVAVAVLAGIAALFYFAPWKKPAPDPALSYAGTWKSVNKESFGLILKEDRTGIRIQRSGEDAGTWSVDKDGAFEFHGLEKGVRWLGKFSADGQVLTSPRSGDELRRESVSPASPVAPAPTPLPTTTPTATPVVAANTGKIDPAKESSYVGTWLGDSYTLVIRADHTAIRPKEKPDLDDVSGTWRLKTNGVLEVHIADRKKKENAAPRMFRLSDDGKALQGLGSGGEVLRVASTQTGAASVPATPAPPSPTPVPPPLPPPTPPPLPPPTPGSAAYYAGTWRGDVKGTSGFVLKADLTGIREHPLEKRGDEKGNWKVDKNRGFEFYNLDGGRWLGKFSADGQSIVHTKSGDVLKRVPAAPKPVKTDPTNPAAYVGEWVSVWKTRTGEKRISVKADRTAIRTESDGTKEDGTWEVVDGSFRCKWTGQARFLGTLSDDGQTMESHGTTGAVWTRQKP